MNEFAFSDIEVGLTQSFNRIIDESMITKFLEISGDINPMHIDREYALSKGYKDRVVYGMLTSIFYSTLVGVYIPGKYALLHGIEIQFSKPVFIGDILTVEGKVSFINEVYQQIEIKAVIKNQDGLKISKATIKAGVINA
jgi:3-hydroxybutyryl-CoA dehydratase